MACWNYSRSDIIIELLEGTVRRLTQSNVVLPSKGARRISAVLGLRGRKEVVLCYTAAGECRKALALGIPWGRRDGRRHEECVERLHPLEWNADMKRRPFHNTRKGNRLSSRRKIVIAIGTLSVLAFIIFALRSGPVSIQATGRQPESKRPV